MICKKKKTKKKRNKIHDIVLFIYIILHEETMHVLLFTCESAEMIGKSGLLLSLLSDLRGGRWLISMEGRDNFLQINWIRNGWSKIKYSLC